MGFINKFMTQRPMMKVATCAAIVAAIFGAAMVQCSCHTGITLVTPNPPTVTDQNECQAACNNLQQLGCEESYAVDTHQECDADVQCLGPTGTHDPYQTCALTGACVVNCVNFCIATENAGVWLDPGCAAKVTSCDQLSACPAPVPQGTSCTGPACKVSPSHKL